MKEIQSGRPGYEFLEPKAKEAIDEAVKESAIIVMMVDGFITEIESFMLRDLLWYARDNGVVVHMVPINKQ